MRGAAPLVVLFLVAIAAGVGADVGHTRLELFQAPRVDRLQAPALRVAVFEQFVHVGVVPVRHQDQGLIRIEVEDELAGVAGDTDLLHDGRVVGCGGGARRVTATRSVADLALHVDPVRRLLRVGEPARTVLAGDVAADALGVPPLFALLEAVPGDAVRCCKPVVVLALVTGAAGGVPAYRSFGRDAASVRASSPRSSRSCNRVSSARSERSPCSRNRMKPSLSINSVSGVRVESYWLKMDRVGSITTG